MKEGKIPLKKGIITLEETQYIKDNFPLQSIGAIAKTLQRSQDAIRNKIKELKIKEAVKADSEEKIYKYELENRQYWGELRKQFTTEELGLFEYYWSNYVEQFGGDILPTEESQLIDVIRYEILINRNLKDQQDSDKTTSRLEKILNDEYKKPEALRSMQLIESLEGQVAQSKAAKGARIGEHVKLQSEKNKLFESLKGTRDQRIKKLEDNKVNMFTLLRQLDDIEFRKQEARRTELFKLAVNKEKAKLQQLHVYEDGTLDRPILNEESVVLGEDEEEKEEKQEVLSEIQPETEPTETASGLEQEGETER